MNKTIGILAHVDAGKTTFAEQLLYHTNSIKALGRVDHKNSFLDSHNIEKERGITVFSDQAIFTYNASKYYLVDTPGHADFSCEMERAICTMDYAIVILSAVEGIQGQTEVVWQLLQKHNIPTFFFINKIDREGSDIDGVLKDIRRNLTSEICYISNSMKVDELSLELAEFIAEHDEKLLEIYLEEGYEKDTWISFMKKFIKERKIFPCFSGSALLDIGIEDFLNKLDLLTYTDYTNDEDFGGVVYKIRHDQQGNKITYIKALKGILKVKDNVMLGSEAEGSFEKIDQIRLYNGTKFVTSDKAGAGELFAVTGLKNAFIGDGVGCIKQRIDFNMIPTMKTKVIFDSKLNPKDVLNYFKQLEEEDPALNVIFDEATHEIQIHIMGIIQIEVLKQLIYERFKLKVDFGPCQILYKETITQKTKGYGHFEPLKHYAEVHLLMEPSERNSGITFCNKCHADDLTVGNQNLIKTHIFEREHHGILTGSTVTDIKITLLTGRAHIKHTCGGDFREATLRALRQGLESTENILLEPYYNFKIKADLDYMGRIISDIQKLNGTFNAPVINENSITVLGRGPVACFMNYSIDFMELTKGKGKISFIFDGYDICHNEEEVIEDLGYNKNADIEYTSTSIFCSKGQSYLVSGSEAVSCMHCPIPNN